MVVVALLSVDLVESVDLVSVKVVVNCNFIFLTVRQWQVATQRVSSWSEIRRPETGVNRDLRLAWRSWVWGKTRKKVPAKRWIAWGNGILFALWGTLSPPGFDDLPNWVLLWQWGLLLIRPGPVQGIFQVRSHIFFWCFGPCKYLV